MITTEIEEAFPFNPFVEAVVRFLDAVKYKDDNYERAERVALLKQTHSGAAEYFAQQLQQGNLPIDVAKIDAGLPTCVNLVVCCYPKVAHDVRVDIAIYYTYCLLLDDDSGDPESEMTAFFEDLVGGREQKNWWWRQMNDHLSNSFLSHYGGFCALNIVRGTFDFFQGCWIERHNFHGFPGAHDFPLYLRRLNGLGQIVAGTLFPTGKVDEKALFTEIASAIPPIENIAMLVNDLISFKKEFHSPQDQTNLIKNYRAVDGIGLDQAIDRLTDEIIHNFEQLLSIFEGKDPAVKATVKAFAYGYITWHLCDARYRMSEVLDRCGREGVGERFRNYYEQARSVGRIDFLEWTEPSVFMMLKQKTSQTASLQSRN